jgi:6-phosphogluconolactonase (cycloisomerase 2 family)
VLGKKPRHITVDPSGQWLIAENQDSDSIIMYSIDTATGKIKPTGQTFTLGSPVCSVFVKAK